MKFLICLLLAGCSTLSCMAQTAGFKLSNLRVYALPFYATKARIVQQLGKPTRIIDTNYECGFLSSSEQGKKFYALHYQNVVFTGNAADGYLLEEVRFDPAGKMVLRYKERQLSGKTSVQDFQRIFGKSIQFDTDRDGTMRTLLRYGNQEDGAMFSFNNGRLVKFEYWSPC